MAWSEGAKTVKAAPSARSWSARPEDSSSAEKRAAPAARAVLATSCSGSTGKDEIGPASVNPALHSEAGSNGEVAVPSDQVRLAAQGQVQGGARLCRGDDKKRWTALRTSPHRATVTVCPQNVLHGI